MKTKIKSIILVVLLIFLTVLIMAPSATYGESKKKGYKTFSVFEETCECEWPPEECDCTGDTFVF